MTDQTTPAGLTRDQAQAVREWAERARDAEVQDATVAHAARVLLAVLPTPPTTAKENPEMTDQTLDDQVRPIVAAMRAAMRRDDDTYRDAEFLDDMGGYIKDLEALLPTPATLADMTLDEQDECTGMQADLVQGDRVVILDGTPDAAGLVQVLEKSLDVYRAYPKEVTPRPDLPRMKWPGTEKPAPALPDGWRLADHQKYGRVVVTRPDPDDEGEVAIIRTLTTRPSRAVLTWCGPDDLTYIDQEADQ